MLCVVNSDSLRGLTGCSSCDVQFCYSCVIKMFPLFSRYVKLPVAEEYSTPCPGRGACNGSSSVAEGKVFSEWLGSFCYHVVCAVCNWLGLLQIVFSTM